MKELIAQVVVGLPLEGPFDYLIKRDLADKVSVGKRVLVSFGRIKVIGFVICIKDTSDFDNLKPIAEVLDKTPSLDEKTLKITKEFSEYYGCSWGEAIEAYIPAFLRKGKYIAKALAPEDLFMENKKNQSSSILLASSRQENWKYISKEIKFCLKNKLGIICLVPEVSQLKDTERQIQDLTKQKIAIIDRRVKVRQEKEQWEAMRRGDIKIALGTRSAVFAPICNLGLIIILNEENASYKQEQSPFYRVHKVADIRSNIEGCKVIYESSTPSIETWFVHKDSIIASKKKEVKGKKGSVKVVDMSNYKFQKASIISFPLQNDIRSALDNKEKMLVLINRRGFSTMTVCNQCGFSVKCPRCSVHLIYSYSDKKMKCTHCNHEEDLPKVCPGCKGSYLRSVGVGVEKLASDLVRFFPDAKVVSYDKDSKSLPVNADIIVATQAVLKNINNLQIAVIAVLDFDSELNRYDFRSSHRAFSLLYNLKKNAEKKVIIQTNLTDNLCINSIVSGDMGRFYNEELRLRKELNYPPFNHIIEVVVRAKNENSAEQYSKELFDTINSVISKDVSINEPQPDIMPKLRDKYRYNIMLKGKIPNKIVSLVKDSIGRIKKRNVIVTINVDP